MQNNLCPYCEKEIAPQDTMKVCPSCARSYHLSCWEEHQGCSNEACAHPGPELCPHCGATLQEEQAFCPECGTAKAPKKVALCSKCATELEENHDFCPKCGQRVSKDRPPKANKSTLIAILTGLIALSLLLFFVLGGASDFNKMYADIATESWCTLGEDGSWMKIDTNPFDLEEDMSFEAWEKMETINTDLGFSSSLYEEMSQTRALDGRQTADNEKFEVSWTYHPDNGLEVFYKVKP